MDNETLARKALGELCEKGIIKETWNDEKKGFDYGLTDEGRKVARHLIKNDEQSRDFVFKIGYNEIVREFMEDNDIKNFALKILKFAEFLKKEANLDLAEKLKSL